MRFIILSAFILFSCGSANEQGNDNIPFDILLQRSIGGKTTQDIVIINDNNALRDVYALVNRYQSPGFDLPEIDFSKYMAIAFFMGEKSTGGYQIIVDSIVGTKDQVVVYYKEIGPKLGEMVTMAFTQPYSIIKMARTSKEITFMLKD